MTKQNEIKTEIIETLLENICGQDDQTTMIETVEEYFNESDTEDLQDFDTTLEDFRLYVELAYGEVNWM